MQCPRCETAELNFDAAEGTLLCPSCGYGLYMPALADAESGTAPFQPSQEPIMFQPRGGIDIDNLPGFLGDYDQVRLRTRLQTARYAIADGEADKIRDALNRVLEISKDHPDVWLYLAAMAPTVEEQRRCLEQVIACKPGHALAMRILAELDGIVQPEPPSASRKPLAEGQLDVVRYACPQCGGQLAYRERARHVVCKFCGHVILDAASLQRTDTHTTVLAGNLKRKQQAKTWNIGGTWLHCNTCGANITVSRNTLTSTCGFCHSQHVVRENVAHTFEQPDVIVPFAVSQEEAYAAIEQFLRSGIRWLTRHFEDAIARIDLRGSYLPFWVFDADMVVAWSWTKAPDHGKHPVLLSDVLFFAGISPAAALLEAIEPFDLRRGVDYDPRLLAAHPARLYDIDMTRASIHVRRRLGRNATDRAGTALRLRRPGGYGSNDDPGRLRMNASTQFVTYRFALLPVWIGTLTEDDGDTRQVLVNGQTGKVTRGPLQKAQV